ncbi:hypothetical protein LQE92_08150 [Lacrimispora sp. NSJ-141]|uniref:Uncharacterized protein n=1 Tax=Lientehia hominis TaxID=2897778 RepID=A0AAP2WA07_9FIRM|nr:hypothetical protein [Lientehia hominis]MCD2492597.1 hypothetical protein [Lientehia hominis]
MRVKIRTKDMRFFLPVPVSMIGLVIRMIPSKVFEEMRMNTPEPYDSLLTKENIVMISRECLDIMKENKRLEIIHVEAADGTFVSIKL